MNYLFETGNTSLRDDKKSTYQKEEKIIESNGIVFHIFGDGFLNGINAQSYDYDKNDEERSTKEEEERFYKKAFETDLK
jgi:hypothetical protein